MNRKLKWIIIGILCLTVGVAAAVIYQQITNTNTITVTPLAAWLDGVPLLNGTVIAWDTTEPGWMQWSNLTVRNNAEVSVTVTFTIVGLPTGWTQVWTESGVTLAAGEQIEGDLQLTIPIDAIPGDYTWETNIILSEV